MSDYTKYNDEQIQAIISKYRLDNNINGLMEIAKSVPKMAAPIKDMIHSYLTKMDKVNNRLDDLEVRVC